MARTGHIRMGKFVHECELRLARKDGIYVHLGQRRPAMFDLAARDDLKTCRERVGLRAPVRLHVPGDDIYALAFTFVRGSIQHRVGLADASRVAEKNLEFAARLLFLFRLHPRSS